MLERERIDHNADLLHLSRNSGAVIANDQAAFGVETVAGAENPVSGSVRIGVATGIVEPSSLGRPGG